MVTWQKNKNMKLVFLQFYLLFRLSYGFQIIDINVEVQIHPEKCQESGGTLVALVHSAPKNTKLRNALRDTWGSTIKTIFVLGSSTTYNEDIRKEAEEFKDILQFDFRDAYRNMTYKHLSGYHYMVENCNAFKYILKSDDDQAIDTFHLPLYLNHFIPAQDSSKFYLCRVMSDIEEKTPKRDLESKWYVPYSEYKHDLYPEYCAGWAYVTNIETMTSVFNASRNESYFWIDDLYVTGILLQKLVEETIIYDWRNLFLTDHVQSQEAFLRGKFFTPELMVASDLKPEEIRHVFQKYQKCFKKNCYDLIYKDSQNKMAMKPPIKRFEKLNFKTEL